jgi:hypothetical protein
MSYRLELYTQEWESAGGRYNERLQASGKAPFLLPEKAEVSTSTYCTREYRLVVDATGEVRGSCLLQRQPGWVDGSVREVVNVQSPLSEGTADKRYVGVAIWMMREVVRQHPLTYSVGMGSADAAYPRLLRALGWRLDEIPFYFRVLAGRKFLANLQPLRKHPRLRVISAVGGMIPLLPDWGIEGLHLWRGRKAPRGRGGDVSPSGPLPEWTALRERYGFAVERTPRALAEWYPEGQGRFIRVVAPGALGILARSRFQDHTYFGNLAVATLVEALLEPGAEQGLLRAAVREARRGGAALLVTNQADPELCRALEAAGWLSYRSNYLAGYSPELARSIAGRPVYLNRGDGDGLLNL